MLQWKNKYDIQQVNQQRTHFYVLALNEARRFFFSFYVEEESFIFLKNKNYYTYFNIAIFQNY